MTAKAESYESVILAASAKLEELDAEIAKLKKQRDGVLAHNALLVAKNAEASLLLESQDRAHRRENLDLSLRMEQLEDALNRTNNFVQGLLGEALQGSTQAGQDVPRTADAL